jgi:hypothetical protein
LRKLTRSLLAESFPESPQRKCDLFVLRVFEGPALPEFSQI